MKAYLAAAFFAGLVLGVLGVLTVGAWHRSLAPTRAYCVRCGLHRDSAFYRDELRPGVVHALLASRVGAHEHRWHNVGRERDADARTMRTETARDELADLDALEHDPDTLALVTEAMRLDPTRVAHLLTAVLDPGQSVDRAALRLLDRPTLAWNDRARILDGFFERYRCERARLSITCTLPVGPVTAVAHHRVPGSVLRGTIPWSSWQPPGFTPTAAPTAVAPTAPTPGAVMVPIPPPTPAPNVPITPVPDDEDEPAPPSTTPPTPPGRDVERVIALASAGRLTEALSMHGRLTRAEPPPAGLSRATAALRPRVLAGIDAHILSGRCSAAQGLFRQARTAGVAVNASDHFGSACTQP